MKKLYSLALAAAGALALTACGTSSPDQPPQAADQIRAACAADAVIRPSVSALLAVPGLATHEQVAAVMAARAVIDPICANPAAAKEAALTGLTNATAQVLGVYVAMKQARAASAPQ